MTPKTTRSHLLFIVNHCISEYSWLHGSTEHPKKILHLYTCFFFFQAKFFTLTRAAVWFFVCLTSHMLDDIIPKYKRTSITYHQKRVIVRDEVWTVDSESKRSSMTSQVTSITELLPWLRFSLSHDFANKDSNFSAEWTVLCFSCFRPTQSDSAFVSFHTPGQRKDEPSGLGPKERRSWQGKKEGIFGIERSGFVFGVNNVLLTQKYTWLFLRINNALKESVESGFDPDLIFAWFPPRNKILPFTTLVCWKQSNLQLTSKVCPYDSTWNSPLCHWKYDWPGIIQRQKKIKQKWFSSNHPSKNQIQLCINPQKIPLDRKLLVILWTLFDPPATGCALSNILRNRFILPWFKRTTAMPGNRIDSWSFPLLHWMH